MEVVDSVNDYLELMKNIFDFESIKNLIQGNGQTALKVLINAMHGGMMKCVFPVVFVCITAVDKE